MELRVDQRGRVAVITPAGRLRLGHGDAELRSAFDRLLDSGTSRFVLDLRAVTTIDSACLGEILACHKQAIDAKGRLHVVLSRGSRIHEFFNTSRLDRVLAMFEDEARAVAAFSS